MRMALSSQSGSQLTPAASKSPLQELQHGFGAGVDVQFVVHAADVEADAVQTNAEVVAEKGSSTFSVE
jgi:hypothetical protein